MSQADYVSIVTDAVAVARHLGASAADAVLVESVDLAVSQRMGKPQDLERAESSGIGLRVFVGHKSAMVSTTDLSKSVIKEACERAVAMAKASVDDPYAALAARELWANNPPELDLCDAGEPDIHWMREQCAIMEDTALRHDGITNSQGADAQASRTHMLLATSDGFVRGYRTSSSSLSVTVLAGKDDKMERDYAYSMARHRDDLKQAGAIGKQAAERALQRLNPRKVSTQSVSVIFDPRVGRSLLGNFAGAISGSAVARGTSFLKTRMGEELFPPHIQIVDDPHRERGLASKPFDAEGVQNGVRHLVRDGRLESWLLDTRSAAQLGLQTTGHAVRGLGSAPYPSSTNLYLQAGNQSPADLIAQVQSGFYVTDVFGMGVNLITGDYSQGASGMWIENGELAYPVSELTIAGHLCDMFAQLVPANDLVFDYGTNAPTMRIERMMVAGA